MAVSWLLLSAPARTKLTATQEQENLFASQRRDICDVGGSACPPLRLNTACVDRVTTGDEILSFREIETCLLTGDDQDFLWSAR